MIFKKHKIFPVNTEHAWASGSEGIFLKKLTHAFFPEKICFLKEPKI